MKCRTISSYIKTLIFCLPLALNAQLHVNEVMVQNTATISDNANQFDDWIEIYNSSANNIDLSGYFLTDDPTNLDKHEVDSGNAALTTVPANGYLILWADQDEAQGENHLDFKLSDGESVLLVAADGSTVISSLTVPSLKDDESFGSVTDGSAATRTFKLATPLASNSSSLDADIQFSTSSRSFVNPFSISLSTTSTGGVLRYSINGNDPNSNSPAYSAPFTISTTTTLKAAYFFNNGTVSLVKTERFVKMSNDLAAVSSDLPIILVHTYNQVLDDLDFKTTFWSINEPTNGGRSYVTDEPSFSGRVAMKIRGATSSGFPKKQWRCEIQNEDGSDKDEVLIGMPADSDWILYGPGRFDRALLTNSLMYELSNRLGSYAPRTRFVEVYYNDGNSLTASDYWGIYMLVEKIKVSDDRVNIRKMNQLDNDGENVSGGYLFSLDRDEFLQTTYTQNFYDDQSLGYELRSPSIENATSNQLNYLTNEIIELETALTSPNWLDPNTGYKTKTDIETWIMPHILRAFSKEPDGYYFSTFFQKDKNGLINAGPIWDFDRAINSVDVKTHEYAGWSTGGPTPDEGLVYHWKGGNNGVYISDMVEDPDYETLIYDRWFEWRRNNALATTEVNSLIDSLANLLTESQVRDFNRWGALDPNYAPRYGGFNGEIDQMKLWLEKRAAWMDEKFIPNPTFSPAGSTVNINSQVFINNTIGNGAVYYTTDGSDPRSPGGAVSATATLYNGSVTINKKGATFLNSRILSSQFLECEPITFSNPEVLSYQFDSGTSTVLDNAQTLLVENNAWKAILQDYYITENTVFQFEFKSTVEGNEHFIGVDGNLIGDNLTRFKVYGTSTVTDAITNFDTYNGSGNYQLFSIPIGQYLTGPILYLIFGAESAVNSYFKNLVIFEDENGNGIDDECENETLVWGAICSDEYYVSEDYSGLVINEIHYNPYDEVVNGDTIGGKNFEFIELKNCGSTPINLNGIDFIQGGVDLNIQNCLTISPNGFVVLADDADWFQYKYGFAPDAVYEEKLDNGGELLYLVDPNNNLIDSLRYNDAPPWPSTADKGFYSLALKDCALDNSNPSSWAIQSVFTTPSAENYFTDFGVHDFSGLVINEIHYNPFDSVDGFGNSIGGTNYEFIELKNITNAPIDLTDVFFSRGIDYFFPDNTMIQPDAFIVLAENSTRFQERYGFAAFDSYGGKLSDSGESIWLEKLTASGSVLLDVVNYDDSFPWDSQADGGAKDYSLALIDGSVNNDTRLNWKVQCNTLYTPGAENVFPCFTGLNYNGLVINEFHYSPAQGNNHEFLEIYNSSNLIMNLEEVRFSSAITYKFKNMFLIPNGYILLARDSVLFQNTYGVAPLGEYVGGLSSNGETIILADLFGDTIDIVSYGVAAPWNTEPLQGVKSLSLIDPSLDNNLAASWCTQDVNISPKAQNSFADTDTDTIIDCLDQCPNFNDNLIGAACDDADPCTRGETYNTSCGCDGGVFQDADGDGVCDVEDSCPGYDDTIDTDNNGIPDGCEACDDVISDFSNSIILSDTSAVTRILTNGRVNAGNQIDYHAGESVELLSGFEVEMSAVFHAYIEPCN